MNRMWIAGVLALLLAAVAATPAGAANGTNAKLCKDSGWKTLYRSDGSTFANQGDCVSYAAKGNTPLTEPPNAWKAACEQSGANFGIGYTNVNGNPLSPPAYAYFCALVTDTFATTVLTPICFGYPDAVVAEATQADGAWIATCIRSGTN
jgi:hypothetical protein